MKTVLYKTVKHFFPEFRRWLRNIDDPRNKNSIEYSPEVMLWVGIMLFLLKLEARRQINYKMNTEQFMKNLSILTKKDLKKIPHGDTLEYLMERLSPEEITKIIRKMITRLLRMKSLSKFRLGSHYLVSVDGTGHLVFKERHCSHCLIVKKKGKIIYYYHNVLEAKLVTETGVALSMATEFIENPYEEVTKQDCELKAFHRLAKKLKKEFPQLKICLLLDALYAGDPVFELCDKYYWEYFITFKKGSMPEAYQEYLSLKKLEGSNRRKIKNNDVTQEISWVNDIDFRGPSFNVLGCKETKQNEGKSETKNFVWLTSFNINESNCEILTRGGRIRWKIENEGFNIQKNGGYALQHPYSKNETAMKNFYLFLQISHMLSQLMEQGSLFTDNVKKLFGSIENFTYLLLESLRTSVFDLSEIEHIESSRFQISLRGP